MNIAQQILDLVEPFVKEGKVLPRTKAQIDNNIDDFVLLFESEELVACAGLKDCKEGGTGEIYALAVSANKQHQGLSSKLLTKIMIKAKAANFSQIFALTRHNKNWFLKQGFLQMEVQHLPKKRQAIFNYQRNSSIFFKHVN